MRTSKSGTPATRASTARARRRSGALLLGVAATIGALASCGDGASPTGSSGSAGGPSGTTGSGGGTTTTSGGTGGGYTGPWGFHALGAEAGVDWRHLPAAAAYPVTLYDHGSGVAAGDLDGDGHADILLLGQCGKVGYYRGKGDGTFTDASKLVEMLNDGIRVSVTFGDYDNDGKTDLYVNYVGRPNALLHQNADGTFTDLAKALGVDLQGHHSGTTFVDVDGDGDLDLVVAGELQYTTDVLLPDQPGCPAVHAGKPADELFSGKTASDPSALFINGGAAAGFKFTEEAKDRGIPLGGAPDVALGFGDVLATDYDRDGKMDLLFVELFNGRTALLHNDGTGHFTNVTSTLLPQASWGAPAAAVADFDNNGFPDVFMVDMHSDMWIPAGTDFSSVKPDVRYDGNSGPQANKPGDNATGPLYGNSLWFNGGSGPLVEKGLKWHTETFMPWGIVAADFDNDGDVDVFMPSGMSNPYDYWPNAFLENTGDVFVQRQADLGFDPPPNGKFDPAFKVDGQPYVSSARAAAVADFDEDGDLDLVVSTWNNKANLYRNDLPVTDHHWLDVDLRGSAPRDPYGAWVEVKAGGKTYVREMAAGRGYLSQSTKLVHFGLGAATSIDSVTVKWLGGKTTVAAAPTIDTRLTVQQP
jgi:hypothetical protein